MTYLWITLVAVFLFVFLRFTSKWLPGLSVGKGVKRTILRIFPVLEFLIWIVFVVKSIGVLYGNDLFYPLIINAIILTVSTIVAWYFLRDFISGIILKSENGFEPGTEFSTSLACGTIKKAGYRSLELINAKGEVLKIPYSTITGSVISKPGNSAKLVEHLLKLEFTSNQEISAIKQQLRKRILEMPWIVKEDNLKLEISSRIPDKYSAELRFFSVTSETAVKIEESIRKFVDDNYFPI